MLETRHPHPHVDPRTPRNGSVSRSNPPVFVWRPPKNIKTSRLIVALDDAFADVCIDVELTEPMFLPETALKPGRYVWKWTCDAGVSEPFEFEIPADSVILEVPSVSEWLERLPSEHPRIYVRPEQVNALRESCHGVRSDPWKRLKQAADRLLNEPHEIEEPPFLPDSRTDYEKEFAIWHRILRESRAFARGAEVLAFAYLAGGNEDYARAACRRMASFAEWDPSGSSHISHNDEAHMSIIWHGAQACDWVWEHFTPDERSRVIEQFRKRGEITFDYMHNRGCYGVSRFDSHAGREIVFLALIALVFHDHIPDARRWLEWLRPVLCGVWPIWDENDGGWAEGISYSLSYVVIMTMFASALKRGVGVDLYRRPFWRNHAGWRRIFMPAYAEWIGFGDTTRRSAGIWERTADLVELLGRETGANEHSGYVAALREELGRMEPASAASGPPELLQNFVADPVPSGDAELDDGRVLHVYPDVGWAAVRTDLQNPSNDIALLFRSSPYGAISHSHANNNDFILHVGGKVMAMPSGYYDGYASAHHSHWVWHTKSHNCVTLSDASQRMQSPDSRGAVIAPFEDDRLAYFCGEADASYADMADRCRRHVVFLKASQCFAMIDEVRPRAGISSCLQWNIHSWEPFDLDEDRRVFRLDRDGSILNGHFLYHHNAFFTLTEGWDPPPMEVKDSARWYEQYHLRFTLCGVDDRPKALGVVLCPGHAGPEPTTVETEQSGETEAARIGEDRIMVNTGAGISYEGVESDALAVLVVGGRRYDVSPTGLIPFT